MADNTEDVKYSFEGDVKSLKQATETAIQLLDSYQKTVQKAVAEGKFNASAKSTQVFNNAINKTSKDVSKMASKLKKVGDVKLPTGSDASKAFESTMATVAKQMDAISNATKVTTKDLTRLKTELNATRATLTGTAPQVDKLVASEQRFQHVLGVVETKAKQVRATMEAMKSKMGSTFDPITNRVKSLSGVFDGIKAKVQSFKDRAAEAFSRVGALASTVASAFRRTSSEADKGDASSGRFAKALEKVSNAFSKLKNGANKVGSLFGAFLTKLGSLSTQASKTNTSFKGLHSTTNLLSKAFVALTGVKIGDWLADATKQSISYIENLNLFTVAMGDAVEEGTAFVNTMQELYGMDPSNLMRYAGNFYQLATAIEMPDAAATNLSLVLTKASNDIASLFNMDIETVFENMSSGMQGMSRAVRKYGMDIRTSTLQTEALALGITAQVESMSEANRMGLRFLTMMKQASNAGGDFARNIETPANQLRIFREQMSQLGRAIGNFFIGPLGTAISYINGFIMALRTVLTFIADVVGVVTSFTNSFDASSATEEAEAIEDIGNAASGTTKKLKNLVAPFDELNILQQNTGSGAGGDGLSVELMDPRISEAIAEMEYKLDNVKMKANQVRDSLLEFFGFKVDMGQIVSWDADAFEANLVAKFPQWSATIHATFENWTDIIDGFKSVFTSLGGVFDLVGEKLSSFVQKLNLDSVFADSINGLASSLNNLSAWIDAHADQLANLVLAITGLVVAFKAAQGVSSAVSAISTVLHTVVSGATGASTAISAFAGAIGGVSAPVLAIIAGVVALVAALVYLWNTSDSFKAAVIEGVQNVVAVLQNFWESVLKPIVENIGNSLVQLWENALQPLVLRVVEVIGDIVELVMGLWNNVLAPLVNWLISSLGPSIAGVFNDVWNVIMAVIESIIGIIDGLLQTLDGLIDFLAGVFTGDWERAWHGLVNILVGIGNTMISIFETVVNGIIGLVNQGISVIFNGIKGLINMVLGAVEGIADLVGVDLNIKLTGSAPQIPKVKIPRIPAMAHGGVVRSPTVAMVGEGKYNEAVIPLGDSPEMAEFVDKIVDAIDRRGGPNDDKPVEVHVYIDSKEVTTAQNNTNRRFGKTTQNV